MVGYCEYFIHLPTKGLWACPGDLPPDILKRPETLVSLGNLELKHSCFLALLSLPIGSVTARMMILVTNAVLQHEE